MIRRAARILFFAVAGYTLLGALVAHLWWALDSGPLTSEPQLVLTDRPLTPAVRVYGDHPELDARDAARLTADALDDAGGFDRSVLVVTIPTGSGWVDPDQVGAFEDWASGDVATVAMRYSSAPSAAVYALRPEVAAISVGLDNRYGHPAQETLDKLEAAGAEIYRTDRDGTIRVRG